MDRSFEFAHERLEAFGVARAFLAEVGGLLRGLPRGESGIADQLRRAGDSVLLNLCEGAGRRAGKEKAHFYDIARASGTECAGALTVLEVRQLAALGAIARARALLHREVCMLVALARRARGDEAEA